MTHAQYVISIALPPLSAAEGDAAAEYSVKKRQDGFPWCQSLCLGQLSAGGRD